MFPNDQKLCDLAEQVVKLNQQYDEAYAIRDDEASTAAMRRSGETLAEMREIKPTSLSGADAIITALLADAPECIDDTEGLDMSLVMAVFDTVSAEVRKTRRYPEARKMETRSVGRLVRRWLAVDELRNALYNAAELHWDAEPQESPLSPALEALEKLCDSLLIPIAAWPSRDVESIAWKAELLHYVGVPIQRDQPGDSSYYQVAASIVRDLKHAIGQQYTGLGDGREFAGLEVEDSAA